MEPHRPCFFVVTKRFGREEAALYWDELPREPIHNQVYVTRLDTLPSGDVLVTCSAVTLFAMFRHARKHGTLPAQYEPPKPQRAKGEESVANQVRTTRVGHRERRNEVSQGSQRDVIERSRAKESTDA